MLEIQNLLRTSLGQPKVTELKTNVILYEEINSQNPGVLSEATIIEEEQEWVMMTQ